MLGGITMATIVMPVIEMTETPELLKKLDKGIEDMENGRVNPHEDTMKILIQQYNDYVSQNS